MAKKKHKKESEISAEIPVDVEKKEMPKRMLWSVPVILFLTAISFILYFKPGFITSVFSDSGSEVISKIVYDGKENPYAPDKQHEQLPEVEFEEFVGAEQCILCHTEQYTLWRNSTHGRAGGEPDDVEIVAKFDGQPLKFKDANVTPTITEEGKYIFKVGEKNQQEQIVPVAAVVGGGHMEGGGTQSFFVRQPDGTVRFLPFDFSRKNDIWFVQLRKNLEWVPINENISVNDLAHWPPFRILGTQDKFSDCQNCHGSQIIVEYDSKEDNYTTRYSTLQINCESCHGPGKKHIELVESADLDTLADVGIISFYLLDKDGSINRCLECHAEKTALRNDFLAGESLEAHYSLKFPVLASSPFLPDGRIREFAYQQHHIFSDCYINGSMTCVDCHEPHSLMYRDVFWKPIPGKFDDGQCTGCHVSKAREPEKHSHHKPDSPGNVCTACHMPFLQHPLIGPSIQFGRSDHTIPIPRPAFDENIGIENACQKCHWDESIEWQQQKTEEWWGKLKPHNPQIANNIKSKEVTNIQEAAELLLNPELNHPVAQLTGLFDFIQRFLQPNMTSLDQAIIEKLKKFVGNPDLDLRAMALVALHLSSDQKLEIQTFLQDKLKNSNNQELALRTRWAFAMDYIGTLYSNKRNYAHAILSHKKALEIKPSDPYTLVNLAMAYQYSGNNVNTIALLEEAIRLEPKRAYTYFQLAYVYSVSKQEQKAIEALKKGLIIDPNNQRAIQMLRRLES